jgi:hypothetical protein
MSSVKRTDNDRLTWRRSWPWRAKPQLGKARYDGGDRAARAAKGIDARPCQRDVLWNGSSTGKMTLLSKRNPDTLSRRSSALTGCFGQRTRVGPGITGSLRPTYSQLARPAIGWRSPSALRILGQYVLHIERSPITAVVQTDGTAGYEQQAAEL